MLDLSGWKVESFNENMGNWNGFKTIHSDISLNNPEQLEFSRTIACKEREQSWFVGYLKMLITDVSHAYNCDETGISLQKKKAWKRLAKNSYAYFRATTRDSDNLPL